MEEGSDLRTAGCCGKVVEPGADAGEDSAELRPDNVVFCPLAVCVRRKHRYCRIVRPALVRRIAMQDRRCLFAGDRVSRSEQTVAVAFHEACCLRPADRFGIPLILLYVCEVHRIVDDRAALLSPEDGNDHCAVGGNFRSK